MSLEITDRRLGEGGFGSVYVGQLGGITVAAKKLLKSKKEFDNLTKEASKLKRLRHGKHIANTYDIAIKGRNLYMVMEYSKHGDLQSYLKANKESVTYEQKILFCRGILLGLLYCHSMKIFHGDIKCSNVLLGTNLEPKLTDFGLSMTVDNIEGYYKMYEGSIHWAAPELFSMEDERDFKGFKANPYPTDVYSLGATFCQVSFDGTTEFLDSNDIEMDISLGLVSPIPKDAFLEEIIDKCCQFERDERITLDDCQLLLDAIIEEDLSVPTIDEEWLRIQQDINANSRLDLPPSFILHRPKENLVVGPSNLSLLEWLCINNCTDAVEYMIQLRKQDQDQDQDQDQIKWLCEISELCKSSEVVGFLQIIMKNSEPSHLVLSSLVDNYPQQFIEMLIKAGASSCSYSLLKKAIERHHNITVQAIVDSKGHLKEWAAFDAVKFSNAEAVKILANAGADSAWSDDHISYTPLKLAIDTENIEIVKILLELGADVNSEGEYRGKYIVAEVQHRPLYLAAPKDNREIVELLINAGATVDITSSEWDSLSRCLEQQGNISMVRFIRNIISKKSSSVEENPLCTAIQNKQPDFMQVLINNKANIDVVGFDGYAPLHLAVIAGDEEIVRILIKEGVDLDARTSNEAQTLHSALIPDYFSECTPLHIAISKGYMGIAKLLIEAGADFSAKNGLQQTIMDTAKEGIKKIERIIRDHAPVNAISIRRAMKSMSHESIGIMISKQHVNAEILSECLCIAISSGKNDLVNCLLKCGVNINNEHRGRSPLWWAIFWGSTKAMETLINAGANINVEYDFGELPLFQCVWESQLDMVQLLVGKGVDVNARCRGGDTPIHHTNSKDVLEILINAGADINAKDRCEITLLIQCVERSDTEMVQFLVDKGADLNAKYRNGDTPIHRANSKDTLEILINAGVDINVKDRYATTPLIQHVKESKLKTVQLLVDKGADLNARDEDGNAPIQYANNKDILEILINAGADINIEDQYGTALLSQHVRESNTEMVQLLVDKGVDVNARNKGGYVPIQYARNKDILEILINAGADINDRDKYKTALLIQYVRESDAEMVQFLVDRGEDVNARCRGGDTPINYMNSKDVLEALINVGADINIKDKYGRTPLFGCVRESNTEMVRLLVNNGADVNARDKYGEAPIHCARNKDILEILINAGADFNIEDQYGRTPLFEHVKRSNTEIVQLLVDKGADVNARGEDGNAPIQYVNNKDILEILINAGADIYIKDKYEGMPLFEHVKESNTEMVQLLVDKGADVNARDKYGEAPIHYARNKDILEILINAGADINAKDKYGRTPLFKYVEKSHSGITKFLVNKGADVNARDKDGNAPIHYAYKKHVLRTLINAGADVNVKDEDGETPLLQRVKKSNTKMVQLLVNNGADVNARDKDGNTPIYYANSIEIVKTLINAGADFNVKEQNGAVRLIQYVKRLDTGMVQFLVDKGVDVNARGEDGNAPIHYADNKDILRILINAGADINAMSLCGTTHLVQYVSELDAEMVQFLVDKGVDVNARDKHGNAPIQYANTKDIWRILINAGADVNAKDLFGVPCLTQYVKKSNAEMVQCLVDKGANVNARDKNGNAPIHFVRDKEIAEILITAEADVNAKDQHGKELFDILIEEQNINLSNKQYKRKKICELLEYLRG